MDSGVINEKLGAWKGSLPNLLYVAITRSKTPHKNFKLMTSAPNKSTLLKRIMSGKRPTCYKELMKFNREFERYVKKKD